jgi:stress response protein YsnF
MVLPGGRIEISIPKLVAGQRASVVVTVEDQEPVEKRHVINISAALPGHQVFENAEEVDTYLREERDAWEGRLL